MQSSALVRNALPETYFATARVPAHGLNQLIRLPAVVLREQVERHTGCIVQSRDVEVVSSGCEFPQH